MSHLSLSITPPQRWTETSNTEASFFNSIEWLSLMNKAFNTKTLYIYDRNQDFKTTISIFKAGPFRIGYLGFPTTTILGEGKITNESILKIKEAKTLTRLHLLRIPTSSFLDNHDLNLYSDKTPESAIPDLQVWSENQLSSAVRRNIRKAKKSGIKITDATEQNFDNIFFRLYSDTVKRNNGTVRYNKKYFNLLIALSQKDPAIRCSIAKINGEFAGYMIVVLDNNVAYYLHGASILHYRQFRPNDLLFTEAITWAKERGMKTFNFMSSPVDQPSLVRYKEKWGAETRMQHVYSDKTNIIQAKLFLATKKTYDKFNSFWVRINNKTM
jgi:hypothetical protein